MQAPTAQVIALSHFFGQHGYLPNYVDLANNINMHAIFVMAGPAIKHLTGVEGLRAVDVAPTLSFLMGIPGPQNARGGILYDLINGADTTDRGHAAQRQRLARPDPAAVRGVRQRFRASPTRPSPSAGSAFLKPWFDTYTEEAQRTNGSGASVITLMAGDSVGATPPISNSFGDTPAIEFMNMMGVDLDGLGNHNFDRGSAYLRNTLIPLADFPFISANVVDSNGKTPEEWSKSWKFDIAGGTAARLRRLHQRRRPVPRQAGQLRPVRRTAAQFDRCRQRRGREDRRSRSTAIIAIGHLGATGGTLTAPTGPLLDLADGVSNVDVVVGDHTDQQVLTTRSNGVLVTENRSKGLRFTRIRIVLGAGKRRHRLQDRGLPQAVGHRRDAGRRDPGQDRRSERGARCRSSGTQVGDSTTSSSRAADACGAETTRTDGRPANRSSATS